ncbi:hypothetical protein N7495_004817 [Penicillium taxi]|uniref:uncharacterized protein n=1 Tax=Penicillium taxi TaxID=168475 RepID=UPI002544F64A|nr:uncharacterized protein N7495_004817 [Penicillium taxi]KAJ5900073.1 hypothetical protein N7495_004817 [Penicillium taxi]
MADTEDEKRQETGVGPAPLSDHPGERTDNTNASYSGSAPTQAPYPPTAVDNGGSGWGVDTGRESVNPRHRQPIWQGESLFLNIPREIREIIIESVLHSCREPPGSPDKINRVDFHDMRYMAWRRKVEGIWNEQGSTHAPSNGLSLLLTSRQLSIETRSVIDRLKNAKSPDYVIEISVLNETSLYPTWLSVPWLTNSIDTLHVDVRLFGSILNRRDRRGLAGDGGRYGFHWSFLAVLERFLRYGPVGLKKREDNSEESEDRGIFVRNLVLDFQSVETELTFPPDTIDYRQWKDVRINLSRSYERRYGTNPDISDFKTKPEWLCAYLTSEIYGLLSLGFHHRPYGQILYERIGTMRFLLNGKLQGEVDLSSSLAMKTPDRLEFGTMFREERDIAYRKWLPDTIAQREKQGFSPVKLRDRQ